MKGKTEIVEAFIKVGDISKIPNISHSCPNHTKLIVPFPYPSVGVILPITIVMHNNIVALIFSNTLLSVGTHYNKTSTNFMTLKYLKWQENKTKYMISGQVSDLYFSPSLSQAYSTVSENTNSDLFPEIIDVSGPLLPGIGQVTSTEAIQLISKAKKK